MNKNFFEIFEHFFDLFSDVYVCNRVWSAWSYDTMTQEDFISLNDTEFNQEFFDFLMTKEFVINQEELILFLSNYQGYYNSDFENKFAPECFHDDWLSFYSEDDIFDSYKKCLIHLEKDNLLQTMENF